MGASKGKPRAGVIQFGKVKISSAALKSASEKLTSGAGSFFIHLIRHVGTAHQRTAEYHFEADGQAVSTIILELPGRDVLGDGQVAPSGLQVLADGGDVGA